MTARGLLVASALLVAVWLGDAHPMVGTEHSLLVTTASPASTTPPPPAQEHSTAEPPAPLQTLSLDAAVRVSLRYAHAAVVLRVRNPARVAQETTFSLLLPDTAFISGFVMTLEGKEYKAYVKEKADAKQEYDAAVATGHAAAHVATKARDSNHLSVRVNVEPDSLAVFNVTYEELLERRHGRYQLAVNLHPGGVVPHLRVRVRIAETRRITELRVPALSTGNEIEPVDDKGDAQNPIAVVERSADEKEATVTFEPDQAEQQRLMSIYEEKSRESRLRSPSHHLYESAGEGQEEAGAGAGGVLGQFVLQYDVDHANQSEILVNDGYFVHFLSPPENQLPPLSKHVVFVLDTSGSMMDRKISQLRDAMDTILDDLRPTDYFNLVEFSSGTYVHRIDESVSDVSSLSDNMDPFHSYEERKDTSVPLSPPARATPKLKALAKRIVSKLNANGGTNINEALVTALRLVGRGVHWKDNATTATTTASKEKQTTTTESVVDDSETKEVAVKSSLVPSDKEEQSGEQPTPIIIFLTDGDPTVGELDPRRITRRISELNAAPRRAAVFSLAFGEDADRSFLRKLSLRNEGFMRHIYEAADAAAQLRSFYRQVSSPLLARVRFVYPPDQVEEGSVSKQKFHAVYAGSEVVVAGRLAGGGGGGDRLAALVTGVCGVQDDAGGKKDYKLTPRVPNKGDATAGWGGLERLWAYITIKQKLEEADAADDNNVTAAANDRALQLALKYSFVTPLTSLVVVKPNASSLVDAESVDKPNNGRPPVAVQSLMASYSPGFAAPASGFAPASLLLAESHKVSFDNHVLMSAVALDSDVPHDVEEEDYDQEQFSISDSILASHPSLPQSPSSLPSGPFRAYASSIPSYSKSSNRSPYYPLSIRHQDRADGLPGPHPWKPMMPAVTSTARPTTPPPPPPAPLAPYGLQHLPWLAGLVNSTSHTLLLPPLAGVAEDSREYKLALVGDAEAAADTLGAAVGECGRRGQPASLACVYLPHCRAAGDLTLPEYQLRACSVRGYAGVCCESERVSSSAPPPPPQPAV